MAVENLKSTSITNLDVPSAVGAGKGGPGRVHIVDDYVTLSASASAGSTYRVVRVPSNCKVKSVIIESEAQGAGKVNVSVYYSDASTDGSGINGGVIVPTTGDQFFASDVDLTSAVTPTDVTNESGNYTLDKRSKALWDALGLTSDPGGFFDIVLVVHTTAVTTGGGKTGLRVSYVA